MKPTFLPALLILALASFAVLAHNGHDTSAAGGDGAAIGKPGDRARVSRTVDVDMSDTMRFTPARIDVKRGETIRLVVRNSGKVRHELVLGSAAALREHAELMRKFPEMEHADPNQVSVDPGRTGELVWRFTRAGTFDFACLQPGHFEAGMVGKVAVR